MSADSTPQDSDNDPQPAKKPAFKRPPRPSGHTLEELLMAHLRADGTRGLTVREMTGAMHIAAETLRTAISHPERLSLASLFGLANLLKMPPEQLLADLFHQVSIRQDLGLLQTRRLARSRRNRATGRDDTTRVAG